MKKRESMLPQDPQKRKVIFLLVIIAASYLFFFHNLGSYSLKEPDEGRYAEIPREMIEMGDYITPHLNYVRYFEKPPLFYWMTALSYKTFGMKEWSFRLPNALIALLCIVITYLFVARWFTDEIGLLSSLMLMSCFGFIALTHIVTIDMLFSCLLFISLLCFFEFYRDKKPPFLYFFFITLALAILAKGPVALILLGATIVLFLLTEKRISFLKEMASVKGLLLFTLLAAPWFIAVSIKEKEFFYFFFVDQHILRFLTTKHKRSGPLYYFLPVLFGGLFPWSFFLPRALIDLWRVKELRLFFILSAVVFAFLSISGSKLPPYILPVFPALCIIMAIFFKMGWHRHLPKNAELVAYMVFFSFLAIAGPVLSCGLLDKYLGTTPDMISLFQEVRGLSLGISSVSLIILVGLAFKRLRTFDTLFYMLGIFSLSVVITLMLHTHVIDGLNTTKRLAEAINGEKKSNSVVVNYGAFDETLPFYIKGRTYIAAYTGELEMGSTYPEEKRFFLNEDEFIHLFQSDRDVWVVFKKKKLARMNELGIKEKIALTCQDNRCVIANHKQETHKQ